jgi:hypothetical protein
MSQRGKNPGVGRTCEEIQLLLPWYANATLPVDETAQVEAHLESCLACSREVKECRELAGAIRDAEPVAPSPHPVQLSRLLARIEAAEGATGPRGRGAGWLRSRLAALGREPVALRWALAAQLAVILGLIAALALPGPQPEPGYRTLADPIAEPAVTQIKVLFAEDATEAEIRRLLLPLKAEITGGPSPFGAYTLSVPATGEGAEPVGVVLAHLRSQALVRFAEALEAR